MTALAALGTALLACVHLAAARFHRIVGARRRPLFSVLTGLTTAYLFMKLLPELGRDPGLLEAALFLPGGSRALFAVAFVGFTVYYAVEVWAYARPPGSDELPRRHVYRVHLGSSAVFNALAAYLLVHHLEQGPWITLVYLLAISVHSLVLDHALAEVHGGRYGWRARGLHVAALAVGVGLALLLHPPPPGASELVLAFFAGAIALQVIKEEVPEHKEGRPAAFLLGAAIMTALLVAVARLEA